MLQIYITYQMIPLVFVTDFFITVVNASCSQHDSAYLSSVAKKSFNLSFLGDYRY